MGKKAARASAPRSARKPIKPLPKHKRHGRSEHGTTSVSSTSPIEIEDVLDSDAPDDMPPKLQGLVHQVCSRLERFEDKWACSFAKWAISKLEKYVRAYEKVRPTEWSTMQPSSGLLTQPPARQEQRATHAMPCSGFTCARDHRPSACSTHRLLLRATAVSSQTLVTVIGTKESSAGAIYEKHRPPCPPPKAYLTYQLYFLLFCGGFLDGFRSWYTFASPWGFSPLRGSPTLPPSGPTTSLAHLSFWLSVPYHVLRERVRERLLAQSPHLAGPHWEAHSAARTARLHHPMRGGEASHLLIPGPRTCLAVLAPPQHQRHSISRRRPEHDPNRLRASLPKNMPRVIPTLSPGYPLVERSARQTKVLVCRSGQMLAVDGRLRAQTPARNAYNPSSGA